MKSGSNAQVPVIREKACKLNMQFEHFTACLEPEICLTQQFLKIVYKDVGKEKKWWASGKIFSPGM
jgi:hypothetical protein